MTRPLVRLLRHLLRQLLLLVVLLLLLREPLLVPSSLERRAGKGLGEMPMSIAHGIGARHGLPPLLGVLREEVVGRLLRLLHPTLLLLLLHLLEATLMLLLRVCLVGMHRLLLAVLRLLLLLLLMHAWCLLHGGLLGSEPRDDAPARALQVGLGWGSHHQTGTHPSS